MLLGNNYVPIRRFTARWVFEPRDVWVGVFWNDAEGFRLIYVCLLPCLPIVFCWRMRRG